MSPISRALLEAHIGIDATDGEEQPEPKVGQIKKDFACTLDAVLCSQMR
jgi:hypothetical protein